MVYQQGDIVLIDTNVIIEAHRIRCWNALAEHFNLHSVEKVIEETQTGFQNRSPEQDIEEANLRDSIAHIAIVGDVAIAAFNLAYGHPNLDDGERHLLVYADSLDVGDVWRLNSPDMAAVRFAHSQKWLDRLVSLEAMIDRFRIRTRRELRRNYTEQWLQSKKTDLRLGLI